MPQILTKHGHERLVACIRLQLFVKGMGIGAVDVNLREERELGALALPSREGQHVPQSLPVA